MFWHSSAFELLTSNHAGFENLRVQNAHVLSHLIRVPATAEVGNALIMEDVSAQVRISGLVSHPTQGDGNKVVPRGGL